MDDKVEERCEGVWKYTVEGVKWVEREGDSRLVSTEGTTKEILSEG